MEYTVQTLGQLAGISTRTLRYYDEIGLLKPARINSSGYRIYGATEVNRLQQILFYRELDVSLDTIKAILTSPTFDGTTALKQHREKLLEKRAQLDALINNVDNSIEHTERKANMTDKEKFEGFKQKLIDDNEEKYGKEIRKKYGENAVSSSNAKVKNMTEEQYAEVQKLEEQLFTNLKAAMKSGDPAGELAQKAADYHKQWLGFYWDQYSKEAHAGLAEMYVADERFTAYYDKVHPGATKFLRDAIVIYIK
ncbi:MerR family transcriptional regulator [Psychrobacillus psychrotolerans]|uniref:MerR family transcriptional regulator n=1 Tax=Psychrobacillus psychrotolerans TaxID=126156 RepID=UPI003B025928